MTRVDAATGRAAAGESALAAASIGATGPPEPQPPVRVLGIRHHGPGSARAVAAALTAYDPDVVLIEGPPEGDALVPWVARGLRPPVALLSYVVGDPTRAAYWPFAVFSPEWQAMAWAVEHRREVRFMDLPAAVTLAPRQPAAQEALPENPPIRTPDAPTAPDSDPGTDLGYENADPEQPSEREQVRTDPIAVLARTAGYDDPERWWDDVVEARHGIDPFDAITEAMAELRRYAPPPRTHAEQVEEDRREAQMRTVLRAATRDRERVAVVCGAWHAPALTGKLPPASHDAKLLRGLPKAKVATTWVPWTHSRLAATSGYGAGITSPGWYQHLFDATDEVVARWFTEVARVLRRHDLPVSSAHAIEATRLAETLAVMRGRPVAGLDEVQEAALAVMCDGSQPVLAFVTNDLVVGERLGSVPDDAPLVPLDADLRAQARSLRLPIAPEPKDLLLDPRKDNDRGKSRLLHRLRILDIPWGRQMAISGTGTFKEGWRVQWHPEFAVAIVVASGYGTTVESAATACLAADPGPLADVTSRIEKALLADLPDALPPLLAALDRRAAHEADIAQLMEALPALVRSQRYGSVRGTDTTSLEAVATGMLARVVAGLPAAVGGLAPEAAAELRPHLDAVSATIGLLSEEARSLWFGGIRQVLQRADVPGLLGGRLTRTLLDAGQIETTEARGALGRALSHGPSVIERAAFAEGFLAGSALLLIHDRAILSLVDAWLAELGADDFLEVLPVLRRALGAYNQPERRALAERISALDREAAPEEAEADLPLEDVAEALATVRLLLGGGTGGGTWAGHAGGGGTGERGTAASRLSEGGNNEGGTAASVTGGGVTGG